MHEPTLPTMTGTVALRLPFWLPHLEKLCSISRLGLAREDLFQPRSADRLSHALNVFFRVNREEGVASVGRFRSQ